MLYCSAYSLGAVMTKVGFLIKTAVLGVLYLISYVGRQQFLKLPPVPDSKI